MNALTIKNDLFFYRKPQTPDLINSTYRNDLIGKILHGKDKFEFSSTALERVTQILSLVKEKQNTLPTCNRLRELLDYFSNEELSTILFGASLNDELNATMKIEECDVVAGLNILQDRYKELMASYKQIEQDIWRTTMTIISPQGKQMLISLSNTGALNWKDTLWKFSFQDLGYGSKEVAKSWRLPENRPETEIARGAVRVLDLYLSREVDLFLGKHLSLAKLLICNNFHQGFLEIVAPYSVARDLLHQAQQSHINASSSKQEKLLDLEKRYQAYCLAYWRSGWTGVPLVEPGSELDTEGFADYVFSQMDQKEICSKKTLVLTIDLYSRAVIADYLVHFKNPYKQSNETHYYQVVYDFNLSNPPKTEVFRMEDPDDFPDLRDLRKLPKFVEEATRS